MSVGLKIVPLRGARGMIADKMVQSLSEAAQLTHHATCDASGLLARKAALASAGQRVSVEDLLIYCLLAALKRHPDINGTIAAREIRLSPVIDLSVAISLPNNLLVAPAIFGAGDMSLLKLCAARQDLISRAKVNKLSIAEMTGGSFTISNLGRTRVELFTPILYPPQIGILGIGGMRKRATEGTDGAVVFRPFIGLSLTFDHRAINGAPAAAALSDICETIEALV